MTNKRKEFLRSLRVIVRRERTPFWEWVWRQVSIAGTVRRLREDLAMFRGRTEAWCEECQTFVGPFKPGVTDGRCCSGHELIFSIDWRARALEAEAKLAEFESGRSTGTD